jgi:tripartite-type tricarboxylate transporter receptor subunit TctC
MRPPGLIVRLAGTATGRQQARPFTRQRQAAIALAVLAIATPVKALDYPTKSIKVVVATSVGGLTDVLGRVFAQKLQERSGQSVVVENRIAATGTVGATFVAKAEPDGYTLLVGYPGNMVVLPLLNPGLPYSYGRDLVPVALFGSVSSVLLINKTLPVNSVRELIALAKSQPGKLTFASQGIASSGHMAAEQFKAATGIDIVHVPYRGTSPAMNDLIAGQVSMLFDTAREDVAQQVAAGNLRALAVTSPARLPFLPNVPTMTEAGAASIDAVFWVALFAPAGTPPAVIAYLNKEAQETFSLPEVRQRFAPQGMEMNPGPPEALGALVAAENKKWAEVIRRVGMKSPEL